MKWPLGIILLAALFAPGVIQAQERDVEPDPYAEVFFAPEFIMRHRRAIDLTDEQRDAITQEIQDLQGRAVSYQFELLDEQQSLIEILDEDEVDIDRAMDQIEEYLETENRVKRAQLELLIRIKNILRPEQQNILREIRRRDSP